MVLNAPGADLGNAHGRVTIDASGVERAMQQAQGAFRRGIQGMSGSIRNFGANVQSMGQSITLMTAPLAAGLGAGVRAVGNFESSLIELQARAGLSAEELEEVRQKALDIGRDFPFSASAAAQAFLELTTSGLSVAEAMATIDTVMIGATASGTDLKFTADALTDIMAQFSVQGVSAEEVLNELTRASGSSSATFSDLVAGFSNAGGMASAFGLTVEETAATLALFSENGIKGAEAGTQLRSMLRNMNRDTEDVVGMWNRLGISMFDAEGNTRRLPDIMAELSLAMQPMTDEQRIEVVGTLGGAFGQLGLSALTTGESVADMMRSMRQAADAETVAEARTRGLNGAIEFLKGSLETFAINTLTPLVENHIEPFIRRVGDGVNVFSEWARANPELAESLGLVAVGLVALGPGLTILGKLIQILPLNLPMIAVLAGLGLAIHNNWLGIGDLFRDFGGTLQKATESARMLVSLALILLIKAAQDLRDWIGRNTQGIAAFTTGIIALAGAFTAFKIVGLIWGMVAAIKAGTAAIGVLIGVALSPLALALIVGAALVAAYTTNFMGFREFINGDVRNAILGFKDNVLVPLLNTLRDIWTIITALPNAISNLANVPTPSVGGFFNNVGNVIGGIPGTVGNFIRGFQTGGVVTRPTFAAIGEDLRGANDFEAVFNRNQIETLIDRIAEHGSAGGGAITININAPIPHPRRTAQVIIDELEDERIRRGIR